MKMKDLILKINFFTAMVLVQLILNTQIGTNGQVRTNDTSICKQTLNVCKIKKDNLGRRIGLWLLSINNFVAAEARYHVTGRANFENPF